jgi:RNA polymerase sigma factor (sigma-70 family)
VAFLRHIAQSQSDDDQLVYQYHASGDLNVLGELYSRYMDLVYGVCLKYLHDTERSKDAVMHIFEELITKLQRHKVDHFRSWLYQVAKNHCLMQLRSPRNVKTVDLPELIMQSPDNSHPGSVFDREESLDQLERCIASLPQDQQEAIRLFYLQGKCYQEITIATGNDWSKVRSCIQNGRRNLKICMQQSGFAGNENVKDKKKTLG